MITNDKIKIYDILTALRNASHTVRHEVWVALDIMLTREEE